MRSATYCLPLTPDYRRPTLLTTGQELAALALGSFGEGVVKAVGVHSALLKRLLVEVSRE